MKIKTKRYYIYCLARIGCFIIGILPLRVGLFLADLAGMLGYHVIFKKERRRAFENLKSVFPEKSDEEIENIAKKVFSNLCKNVIEWLNAFKLNKKNIDGWIEAQGFEKLDRVFSKGKGTIGLASHLGNWELMHIAFALKGYPGTAIARRMYFDKYGKFLEDIRTAKGVGVVYRDESPKKLLRLLKKNKLIGILADQDVDSVDGVFVDFFGKPAYTPKAPAAFSLASGAPIVPCFMIRKERGHRIIVEEPIEMEKKSDKAETIRHNTQRWSDVVESYIRKYPEQWVWMHARWKTKPVSL